MLSKMIGQARVPQTLLLAGPEGIGKATLARRFAALLLGGNGKIERDDLSLAHNLASMTERERWPAEKRSEEPLFFASHPDFLTFPPDGPLRQISIQQMRLLKERAQFKPFGGKRSVFLIDRIDRAGEQAANSLLKILEEPPDHLILVLTAENPYDLLPTIRSRAVPFHLTPLREEEMRRFAESRGLSDAERRVRLASGSPGLALSLDLEAYDRRREAMLTLLRVAAAEIPFGAWVRHTETAPGARQEKLEPYLKVLYMLLEDLLVLVQGGGEIRNSDVKEALDGLAARMTFDWIRSAVKKVDELAELLRRNIQKNIALDAFALELRAG